MTVAVPARLAVDGSSRGPVRSRRTPQAVRAAVLVVCLATGFTTLLDQSMLTVAVPVLRGELGASTAQLQWILAGYSLTFGIALVPAGRLGDLVGRRLLLVAGIVVFSGSSLVGATASGAGVLVLSRLLQGIGAGIANPQVIGLMQDHFTGSGRARAFGAYGSIGAFSAVIAPLVGGSVIAAAGPELGWRLVVGLNIPSAIVVVALALWLVPAAPAHQRRAPRDGLDAVGIVLITLSVLALLVPFVVQDASIARRVLLAAPLAVVVPALALWERRYARSGRVPVLAPELVRSPGYVLGCLVATFSFGQALGYSAVLMLFLQDGLGLSPVQAGLVTTPGAIVSGVVGNLSWRVLRRWGRAGVTASYAAKVVTSIGVLVVVLVVPERGFVATLVVAQVITGALTGLSFSPNQTLTLEHAAPGRHGVAAGALQLAQRISSTVCLAAMTGAYVAVAGPHAVVGHPGATTGHRAALAVATGITIALAAGALAASIADDTIARRRKRSTVVSMLECRS